MQSKSRSSSASSTSSTYSHLLYLNNQERDLYFSSQSSLQLSPTRPESTSFFSMSSSRCSSIRSSASSTRDSVSTGPSSIKSATIATPKYADDHYPLITATDPSSLVTIPSSVSKTHTAFSCAKKMAAIHNTFIRALNSAYNHAPAVVAGTQRCKEFIQFNQILCNMIHHHHETEDEFLFPAWEKLMGRPGGMEENIKGHEAFMDGFHVLHQYVEDPDVVSNYDGVKFRKMVEGFAPEFIQHLHDEIPTIVGLCIYDDEEMRKIWAQADKIATSGVDMHTFGPMMLGCQDKSFLIDGELPPFPGLPWVAEVLIKKWYARKHSSVWEFCPSDLSGQRRLL